MKQFLDYLKESIEEKKYTFKIKIAGDLPDHCEDVLESSLQQYKVFKFTKGKTSPIQATLLDFPNVTNSSTSMFEVELDYPATSAVITELVANATGVSRDFIKVRTPTEEVNFEIENKNADQNTKPSVSLLSQDYEKSNNQSLMGEKQVSNFLKDLAKVRKDTESKQYKGANDQLLAKKLHKEKSDIMPNAGPAKSLFGGIKKD